MPWNRKWHFTSVFLAGESHGQRSLVGYSPWCRKESDTTEWLNTRKITDQIFSNMYVHACMLSCFSCVDSFRPYGLYPVRLLCPWDSPAKNIEVGCHFLLQGISLTQWLNKPLLHWQTFFNTATWEAQYFNQIKEKDMPGLHNSLPVFPILYAKERPFVWKDFSAEPLNQINNKVEEWTLVFSTPACIVPSETFLGHLQETRHIATSQWHELLARLSLPRPQENNSYSCLQLCVRKWKAR